MLVASRTRRQEALQLLPAGEKGKFYPRRAHTEGKMVCAPARRVILAAR